MRVSCWVCICATPPLPARLLRSSLSKSALEEDATARGAWVGAEPEFVRSRKKDDGQRQGAWNTEGLQVGHLGLARWSWTAAARSCLFWPPCFAVPSVPSYGSSCIPTCPVSNSVHQSAERPALSTMP